jgi:hypothetical protein
VCNGCCVLKRAVLLRLLKSRVVQVAYLVVGLLVANAHNYFNHLDRVKQIASAVLAVLLWPLVLLGVDLHIK